MIHFTCIACGHLLQIKEYFAGCKVQCPSCKAELQTPENQAGPSPAMSLSSESDDTVALPRPAMPRPPALPEPRSQPHEEPMVAIPGLLEGSSAALAIPVSLPPPSYSDSLPRAGEKTIAMSNESPPNPHNAKTSWLDAPSWIDAPRKPTPQAMPPPLPRDVLEAPVERETSGKALGSLILGLCTFVIPILCAIPAFILAVLALMDIRRRQGLLEGRGIAYTGLVLAFLGNLSLVPAWMLKSNFDQARNEKRVKKNLEEVAKALLRYEMENVNLPLSGLKNDKGETTLSWRVAILPQLGNAELYKKFHLKEAWDSPHNKALLASMPPVFASESQYGYKHAGTTHIQVITGLDTFFPDGAAGSTRGVGRREDRLLVVEGREAVPWTKPVDLVYKHGGALPLFGASSKDGFYAVTADGMSRFIDNRIDKGMLHTAINPRDGGFVDFRIGLDRGKLFGDPVHVRPLFEGPPDGFDFKDAAPKVDFDMKVKGR